MTIVLGDRKTGSVEESKGIPNIPEPPYYHSRGNPPLMGVIATAGK